VSDLEEAIAAIASEALALSRLYAKRKVFLPSETELTGTAVELARRLKLLRAALRAETGTFTDLKVAELRLLARQLKVSDVYTRSKLELQKLILEKMGDA